MYLLFHAILRFYCIFVSFYKVTIRICRGKYTHIFVNRDFFAIFILLLIQRTQLFSHEEAKIVVHG